MAKENKINSGDQFTEYITSDMAGVSYDTSFNMIFVEGGTFTLGWESEDETMKPENVEPVPNVTVSDFYIGETEVTVEMWDAVMGLSEPGVDANRPVEYVNFYQAQDFLARLYNLTGKTYRLATEAEWEFAAKGGNPGKVGNDEYPGNNHKYLFAGSNIHDDVVADVTTGAKNVKTKKPNILGIYDMCGNTEEWVYNSWDSNLVGGVDPIGPSGPFHQQKTRRGGTYGSSANSTRTLASRQVRSIDGGVGMGFRLCLSGDMNSVPPGMVRPKDVVHPNIDERNLPVTYRDPRWITNDNYVWLGSFGGFLSFEMKIWETGEMAIRSPGYTERTGQWYSVSNLGIVFVENAFQQNEKRIIMPYMFITEELATIINDVSFYGDGAPMGRFEKKEVADSSKFKKPEYIVLYPPEELAKSSTHDHTSYDLSNITEEMKGKDRRLINEDGFGWWLTTSIGIHQYREDITEDDLRFVVYSPAFPSESGGADPGYGANYLAQGKWYTINDMLLVVDTGDILIHYLYTVTPEVNSYVTQGKKAKQMLHISYADYEKGDARIFECHPNKDIRGYTHQIPEGEFKPFGISTFRREMPPEPLCPGGCGYPINHCRCNTICPDCGEHINNCCCHNVEARLAEAVENVKSCFEGYQVTNNTSQAHLDAAARLAIGLHQIKRSWIGFKKTNATKEKDGSITGTLTLILKDKQEHIPITLVIPCLAPAKTKEEEAMAKLMARFGFKGK